MNWRERNCLPVCHELEHLEGHLYVEKVEGELMNTADLYEQEEE